jgi:hypothetical protein
MGWLRVRRRLLPGTSAGLLVERLADGYWLDPAAGAFVPPLPPPRTVPLAPMGPAGKWATIYRVAIPATGWKDGRYAVYTLDIALDQFIGDEEYHVIRAGDDAP